MPWAKMYNTYGVNLPLVVVVATILDALRANRSHSLVFQGNLIETLTLITEYRVAVAVL